MRGGRSLESSDMSPGLGGGKSEQPRRGKSLPGHAPPPRVLPAYQLGSVIFGCTKDTIKECFAECLFGLPRLHISYVKHIREGLPLFLFDYSSKVLHGIFEAAGNGDENINPLAWSRTGGRKAFPAQVRVRIRQYCRPLPESVFKNVITENYYTEKHFQFELDHFQTRNLCDLFINGGEALLPYSFGKSLLHEGSPSDFDGGTVGNVAARHEDYGKEEGDGWGNVQRDSEGSRWINQGNGPLDDAWQNLSTSSHNDGWTSPGSYPQNGQQIPSSSSGINGWANAGTHSLGNDGWQSLSSSSRKDGWANSGTYSQGHDAWQNPSSSSPKDGWQNLGSSSHNDGWHKPGSSSGNDAWLKSGTYLQGGSSNPAVNSQTDGRTQSGKYTQGNDGWQSPVSSSRNGGRQKPSLSSRKDGRANSSAYSKGDATSNPTIRSHGLGRMNPTTSQGDEGWQNSSSHSRNDGWTASGAYSQGDGSSNPTVLSENDGWRNATAYSQGDGGWTNPLALGSQDDGWTKPETLSQDLRWTNHCQDTGGAKTDASSLSGGWNIPDPLSYSGGWASPKTSYGSGQTNTKASFRDHTLTDVDDSFKDERKNPKKSSQNRKYKEPKSYEKGNKWPHRTDVSMQESEWQSSGKWSTGRRSSDNATTSFEPSFNVENGHDNSSWQNIDQSESPWQNKDQGHLPWHNEDPGASAWHNNNEGGSLCQSNDEWHWNLEVSTQRSEVVSEDHAKEQVNLPNSNAEINQHLPLVPLSDGHQAGSEQGNNAGWSWEPQTSVPKFQMEHEDCNTEVASVPMSIVEEKWKFSVGSPVMSNNLSKEVVEENCSESKGIRTKEADSHERIPKASDILDIANNVGKLCISKNKAMEGREAIRTCEVSEGNNSRGSFESASDAELDGLFDRSEKSHEVDNAITDDTGAENAKTNTTMKTEKGKPADSDSNAHFQGRAEEKLPSSEQLALKEGQDSSLVLALQPINSASASGIFKNVDQSAKLVAEIYQHGVDMRNLIEEVKSLRREFCKVKDVQLIKDVQTGQVALHRDFLNIGQVLQSLKEDFKDIKAQLQKASESV